MASVKMTFSLDEETVGRLRQASESLKRPKSEIIREAVRDFVERKGRLGEAERRRLLDAFDESVSAIPLGAVDEVERELGELRASRRTGGRRLGA